MNRITTILLDADGVLLKKNKEYFSERYAREYHAPIDEIRNFFKTDFPQCQEGKLDLKIELAKHLKKWKWPYDVDSFLERWFSTDIVIDAGVLEEVRKLRSAGFKCYLATDQEHYRAKYLVDHFYLGKEFDAQFFSYEIGHQKSEPEFFKEILNRTKLKPEEILYFDDDQKNVDCARAVGIQAALYTRVQDLRDTAIFNQ